MVDQDTLSDGLTQAPRTMKRAALGLSVAFAVVEGAIRVFDLYRRVPWVDVPSHLLSGGAVTALLLLYLGHRGVRRRIAWSLVGNLVVAIGWEIAEMVDEIVTPDPVHLQDVFVWDGLGDIVAALVGGSILLWVVAHKQPRNGGSHRRTAEAIPPPRPNHGR